MTTRPAESTDIPSGIESWDAVVNDNFTDITKGPFPVFRFVGDATALENAHPATNFENCMVVAGATTLLSKLYWSKNTTGSTWEWTDVGV